MSENILVIPKFILDDMPPIDGFTDKPDDYIMRIFGSGELLFKERSSVEQDESFLQIIPYVVVFYRNQVLVYQRTKKGGEARLHDKFSLGFGGHIRDTDDPNGNDIVAFFRGMKRELKEEVILSDYNPVLSGMIYDDSNPVGRVHLGVLYNINVTRSEFLVEEEELTKVEFMNRDKVKSYREAFEGWSQILIDRYL